MKVLQIDVSAIRDKFYLNLFSLIKERGIEQIVYTPYKETEYTQSELEWAFTQYKKNEILLEVAPIKTTLDRLLYRRKIKKYFNYLDLNYNILKFDMIHAHSLYSDGGVAYQCHIKYDIPYVVAVRSTDIEFMTVFPHLSIYARKVLEHASKIIYLSNDLKNDTIRKLFYGSNKKYGDYSVKSVIVPNGVNQFWIDNVYMQKREIQEECIKILQVSRLERRKKVDETILAVSELKEMGINCELYVVGEGSQRKELEELVEKKNLGKSVLFLGYISDKAKLLQIYRESDIFCMPSKGETFGIVYVEALTQGLPVLGLKGTGVSAYFSNKEVGYFINQCSPKNIAKGIKYIIENYQDMSSNTKKRISEFEWKIIIDYYIQLYSEIA